MPSPFSGLDPYLEEEMWRECLAELLSSPQVWPQRRHIRRSTHDQDH